MAGAFQSSAFQNNAFQVDGTPPPPTPGTGGGGGGSIQALHAERKRKRKIAQALDRAIAEALNPTPVAEYVADEAVAAVAAKVWRAPPRRAVFPDAWRNAQILELLNTAAADVGQQIQSLVAAQWRRHQEQMQDEEAASALLQLMVRDLL